MRQRVTRLCNAVDAEIALPIPRIPNITTLDDLIEQLAIANEQLEEKDKIVEDAMLDEGKTEAELQTEDEECDGYRNKIRLARKEVKLFKSFHTPASASSHGSSTTIKADPGSANYLLPKIELSKFNGDKMEWLGWWSQFQKIDEDDKLHPSDKFQYLVQSTEARSKARELVNRFPQSAANYPEAIEALKERFGKPEILQEVYIRELLKMVNVTSRQKTSLSEIYDKFDTKLRALKTLGVAVTNPATFLFPMMESSIPEETLKAWIRSPLSSKDGSKENPPKDKVDYLLEFLKAEVEGEDRCAMAAAGFAQTSSERKKEKHRRNIDDVPTTASM